MADELQAELIKVDEVGFNYVIGGQSDQIRIEPDPERLALYGITLNQLVEKVENANRSFIVGNLREDDRQITTLAGQTLRGVPDVGLLVLTSRDGRPVYVKDVADVVVGAKPIDRRAWHIGRDDDGDMQAMPAVSLAIAKREGANAVTVAEDVLARLEQVKGRILPDGIDVHVVPYDRKML